MNNTERDEIFAKGSISFYENDKSYKFKKGLFKVLNPFSDDLLPEMTNLIVENNIDCHFTVCNRTVG